MVLQSLIKVIPLMSMNGMMAEIKTPYGVLSLDAKSDAKMLQALQSGLYPNDELVALARHFVTPESVVVDVGAHVGTFTVAMAHCSRVIAFEPAPASFALLQKNTSRLTKSSVDVRNKGLAAEGGLAHVVERNSSNAGAQTLAPGGEVTVSTLDVEVQHADFIKIDVEGMEFEVLNGGVNLISKSRPPVLFEVNLYQLRAHGASPSSLQKYFAKVGYRLFYPLLKNGVPIIGLVRNTTLLTIVLAPRSWFFWSDSAPFDLIAIPKERELPSASVGFGVVLLHALRHNIKVKWTRLQALLR